MVGRVASTSAAAHTVCGGGRSRGAESGGGRGRSRKEKGGELSSRKKGLLWILKRGPERKVASPCYGELSLVYGTMLMFSKWQLFF